MVDLESASEDEIWQEQLRRSCAKNGHRPEKTTLGFYDIPSYSYSHPEYLPKEIDWKTTLVHVGSCNCGQQKWRLSRD